jgi:hypothetical protein
VGTCIGGLPAQRGEGSSCNDRDIRCEQGLYCSSEGECRPRVENGEPCDTPFACADSFDFYCAGLTKETLGACAKRVPVGDACDPEEEVVSCSPGYSGYCGLDGTCVGELPRVCNFLTPHPDLVRGRSWVPE